MEKQHTGFGPGAERSEQMEKSCGAVVFTRESGEIRYVLAQSLDGLYGFPKGHMEKGENEQNTVLREIREEVGLQPVLLNDFRQTISYPLPSKPGVTKHVTYCLAEYQDQEIRCQPEELLGASLMPYEEAYRTLSHQASKAVLEAADRFIRKR